MNDRLVQAVLWDADGVLQHLPVGWEASMRPAVGHLVDDVEGFLAAAFAAERPCLTGEGRWVQVLPRLLEAWGIPEALDDALRVWLTVEPVEPARALAAKVRGQGVRCYLATNQDEHRGRFMERELGYDELLDGAFYSYELRAAKPDPAFFHAVLDRLGLPPDAVLLVDDNEASVDSALALGMRAETWHVDHGVDALRDRLARHGLDV